MTNKMQFNLAIIGAGYMAEEHIKVFNDIPTIKCLGIFSRTKSRAHALALKYNVTQIYDSVASLYAGTKADLVVIAVSELSVNEVCKQAFNFPWTVLIEKPVGYNFFDAQEILDSAEKADKKVYVALNRRHYSSTRSVSQELEIEEGKRLVQVFDQESPKIALEQGCPALVVENWMYANSIHLIDYFCLFCRGKVTRVENVIKWDPVNPLFVLSKVEYSSGDIGVYHAVWNAPGPWAVNVTTRDKRWEMRPLEYAFKQVNKSRKIEPISLHPWDSEFKPGLRLQAEETIRALSGEANKLPTLSEAMESMNLIKQIYRA